MSREVSVRTLRNETASVVSLIESGERVTLTVNRRPVADIVPHVPDRDPWVPATMLRQIIEETPADSELLNDLREIRDAVIEE
ncbi:MAG: prevent-host-death family protein [Actinomycetota bacterium]|nr:prevent-host-death family protein [Actinomycetota bacterium]